MTINITETSNGICKCCNGTGVQHNSITGLTVECPCCNGTGKKADSPTKYWS